MKNALTLGTLLLGCCLAATAQMGSTPNQAPPGSTPSTFPQDQTVPSHPVNPADRSANPPDTNAPGQMTHDHAGDQAGRASSSQVTTIQGCLSQSQGNFMLADNSGNKFQLRGDTSKLNSYIGKEVKVDGMAASGGSNAGAMASSTSTSSGSGTETGTATQFSVSDVHKVADACTMGSAK